MTGCRRGVILPVVLLVLVLLGLLVAMFSFRVNADLSSTQAVAYRMQTRLAAETGIDRVKQLLADARFDMDRWYHNPDELHRVIVWNHDGDETVWGTNDEFDNERTMDYRFSIVADDPTDDEDFVRFGITDESSKLNLNTATRDQLLLLVRAATADDPNGNPEQIVDAILDWRDVDRNPQGQAGDTEGLYYQHLPKPYRVKNGPFDTVEELLLVKGVTGQVLYGEDYDRNGLLTPNEDDGDRTFPPDNEDGRLNRGLYPYLTVLSSENNVSNENRRRVYLLEDQALLQADLSRVFPDDPGLVEFIVTATRTRNNGGNNGNAAPGGDGDRDNQRDNGTTADAGDEGSTPPEGGENQADRPADAAADGSAPSNASETNNARNSLVPIRSPVSLLLNETEAGQQVRFNNPLTVEHLPVLLDQTTTVSPREGPIRGLININTAPRLVLKCIEGLTDDQIDAILGMRDKVAPEDKMTPAWLVTEGVLDLNTLEKIAPFITARGQQFTIESLGYADHVGMVTRLQVVVDMVGPIAQTVYYRDLTYLGGHFPIREKDLEKQRVR